MKPDLPGEVTLASEAARDKQADDMVLLDLAEYSSFTTYFLICSARNPRQGQAISDEIHARLNQHGFRALHIEGYNQAEWILMDYAGFVIHIFSQKARAFYDLERLWRSARRVNLGDSQ